MPEQISAGLTAQQMEYEAKLVYEAIAGGNAPGYTSRQWSVLLTQAQEKIIQETISDGWDKNETNRRICSKLLETKDISSFSKWALPNSFKVEFPSEFMHIVQDGVNDNVEVKTISWDYYHANKDNPFEKPDNKVYWKMIDSKGIILITDGNSPSKYFVVYLKRPEPIITRELTEATAIENKSLPNNCKLDPITHRMIVQRAARLAEAYTNNQLGYQIKAMEELSTK